MKLKAMTMSLAVPGIGYGSERHLPGDVQGIELDLDVGLRAVKVSGGQLGDVYVPVEHVLYFSLPEPPPKKKAKADG